MPYVMQVLAMHTSKGIREFVDGVYIESFDVEANGGRGDVEFTEQIECAHRFATAADLMAAWCAQSQVKPLRDRDGKPNKPLTAMTVLSVEVE